MTHTQKSVTLLCGLFCALTFTEAKANKKPVVKICLAGAPVKIFPPYGEAFLNGARLAVKRFGSEPFKVVVEEHFYDPTPLSPRRSLKSMLESGCTVAVGFSSQNDLLAIRNLATRSGMVVISIYGELNNKLKQVGHITTMQPPPNYLVKRFEKFLDQKFPKKGGHALVATAVDRHSLKRYRTAYQNYLTKRGLTYDHVEFLERHIDINQIKRTLTQRKKPYDTLVLLGRSLNSAKIADLVYKLEAPNQPLILGTKNFGSAQLPGFLTQLQNKLVRAFFPRHSCLCDPDPKYQEYLKAYTKEYKKQPMVISGHTYDATKFILTALKKLKVTDEIKQKGWVSPRQFLNVARTTTDSGVTGVVLGPELKANYSKHFIVSIKPEGYKLVESSATTKLAE